MKSFFISKKWEVSASKNLYNTKKMISKCARYAVKNTGEIEARLYLGCERSSQNLKARASLKHWKKEASRRA